MKLLLIAILIAPSIANACLINAHLLERMIKRGEVTVTYKPNEMIVTCDTKAVKLCDKVFDYYRKHKSHK